MNTSLGIIAAILVAAATGFVTIQSAAAEFDTSNTSTQTASNTATGTGGDGGNGGDGGSVSIDQSICQQAAQSGAFGSSSNKLKEC
jgi:uncharacterized membrane protein